MNDSDRPSPSSQEHYYDTPSWAKRLISELRRRVDKHRSKRKHETAQDRAARRTANATVAMAFFTLVVIGVSIAQWNVLNGQLAEMRNSGADTHNLTIATQNLSKAYRAQERDMAKLRDATQQFAHAMDLEANSSSELVEEAKHSADAAETQVSEMRAEREPIIEMDSHVDVLAFDVSKSPPGFGRPVWSVGYMNNGKSVANVTELRMYMKLSNTSFICAKGCTPGSVDKKHPLTIAPTETEYQSAEWPNDISQAEFDALNKTDHGIIVQLSLRYNDEAGRTLSSSICLDHYANGSIADCSGEFPDKNSR